MNKRFISHNGFSSDCLSSNLRQTISVIYTRGSTSAALSKQVSGPGGSEGQRSSSTAVTSVQGGADDHTMEIDQVSDGKCILLKDHSFIYFTTLYWAVKKRNLTSPNATDFDYLNTSTI